jgi:hypothetical protein
MGFIEQYGALILLTLFVITVGFSMLFGMGRGLKRSVIRLITVVLFIGGVFLLTPLIASAVYNWDLKVIGGQSVKEFVDSKINEFAAANADMMTRIRLVMPDFELFVLGIGFAVVNIVLFFLLYFVTKWISWIVYAIVAKSAAPKINKETGTKNKKYVGFGLLVGAVQGIVLFFFLLIPVNGFLALTGEVAGYKAFKGEIVLGADSAQVQELSANETGMNETEVDEVFDTINWVHNVFVGENNKFSSIYGGIIKYTGLEFLSNAAFKYQMTIRLEKGGTVDLAGDIVKGIKLTKDTVTFMNRVNDIKDTNYTDDMTVVFEKFNSEDYKAMKYIVNELFKLEMFKVVDNSMVKIDALLASGDGQTAYTLGAVEIKSDSIYMDFARQFSIAENEREFIIGIRAIVSYIGSKATGIFKDDINNTIDIIEYLFKEDVTTHENLISKFRSNDFKDIITVLSDNGNAVFKKLFDYIQNYEIYKILSQPNVENIILYGNFIDGLYLDGELLLSKADITSLMGNSSKNKWSEIKSVLDETLSAVKDFVDAGDIIQGYKNNGKDDMAAIIEYIANDLPEEDNILDNAANALVDMVFLFPSMADYAEDYLSTFIADSGFDFTTYGLDIAKIFDKETGAAYLASKLRAIAEIAVVGQDILEQIGSGELDLTGLLESDNIADIKELIESNTDVADLVAGMVEGMMSEMLGESSIGIEFPEDGKGAAIVAILDVAQDIVSAMESVEDGVSGMVDALVGEEGVIEALLDSGVHITLPAEDYKSIASAIDGMTCDALGDIANSMEMTVDDVKDALKDMFKAKSVAQGLAA